MSQLNFKDRLRKPSQEQQINPWSKQNNTLTKNNSKKDLFKTATNILSQQFEPGDLKRGQYPNPIQLAKKRNSSILEAECQQDMHQQIQQQNYYNGGIVQRGHPGSMMNSNTVDNYSSSQFDSKLLQTKGQLCQHINDVQKRMRKQLQKDRNQIQDFINRLFSKYTNKAKQQQNKTLNDIVNQLNIQLQNASNKHKKIQGTLKQHEQRHTHMQKQFNQFTTETEQKLQKLINSNLNAQVGGSMKKSFSRNMGNGDYMIQAKNSIKDIPVLNTTLVQQIRTQILQTQQSIKSIRLEIGNIKQDLKAKIMNSLVQTQKQKQEVVEISKINFLTEDISNLRNQIRGIQTDQNNKIDEIMRVLQTQQENWIGMNQNFHKSINNVIIPRVKKTQDQLQCQTIEKYAECLKKQVLKQLQSLPIIRVKGLTEQQKEKIQKMGNLPKSQQQAYMMDESNLIMDCFGRYLVDQNNQKIKLQEEQIYYLEKIEGIQIKLS